MPAEEPRRKEAVVRALSDKLCSIGFQGCKCDWDAMARYILKHYVKKTEGPGCCVHGGRKCEGLP